jgi:hypothetical protein
MLHSDGLIRVTTECDKAIGLAIESRDGKGENEESNLQFEEAIRVLGDYESRFHPFHDR